MANMKPEHHPGKNITGEKIRDFILGAQDGIVNVLGLVLGVASATLSTKVVLISGIAGLFAESISMGAVAFTSSKAARDYYTKMERQEKREMKEVPEEERKEIEDIYRKRGFKGNLLQQVVRKITSKNEVWLQTMMEEEIKLSKEEYKNPIGSGFFVLLATIFGSLVPLIPFFFMPVKTGIIASVAISGIVLFAMGAAKGKLTIGDWKKTGMEMFLVGILAAVSGYFIGLLLGNIIK